MLCQAPSIDLVSSLGQTLSVAGHLARHPITSAPVVNGFDKHTSKNMKRWLQEKKSQGPWTGQ